MPRLTRAFLPLLLLFIALLPATTCAAENEDLTLYFKAAITIEPDGSLSRLAWKDGDEIPGVLRDKLDARVNSWQFVPGTVDGAPARTDSTLRLRLRAPPAGAGLTLKVENAETGPAVGDLVPPEYPRDALRRGAEAAVLADLFVAEDGSREVVIAGYEGDERMRPKFEDAVEDMLAHVDVQLERVGGHLAAGRFSVPVEFCAGTGPCGNFQWPAREAAGAPATTAPGQPMPGESVAGIATDVRDIAI